MIILYHELQYFNPRSRTGSDKKPPQSERGRNISTHAPAQGATCIHLSATSQVEISTHAPAQGATLRILDLSPALNLFQPTLPHRERRRWAAPPRWPPYFNPRSRTGSDAADEILQLIIPAFQPTLPHRERRKKFKDSSLDRIFQPTLPHRERRGIWAS